MFKSRRPICSRSRRPALEALEGRSLLSVGITEFAVPAPLGVDDIGYNGKGITAGADGNIWFHLENEGEIGRITPDGLVTDFSVPSPLASVGPMTEGPDGNIWFIGYTPLNDVFLCSMTPTGAVTEFPMWHDVPTTINSMTVGPDGNFWFAGWWEGAVIGRVTPTGQVTVFDTPPTLLPNEITAGPDGSLWFTEMNVPGTTIAKIGRITPGGTITEFDLPGGPIPMGSASPITSGPDGNLWYTRGSVVGRITPLGQVTEFPLPPGSIAGIGITQGPEGSLWFTQFGPGQVPWPGTSPSYIGQITTDGQITEYQVPSTNWGLGAITTGPDGNLWFTENVDKIGRVTFNASGLQPAPSIVINQGTAVNGVLATFTAPNTQATASDYSATISWGDGSQSTATVTVNGTCQVSGSHVYAAAAGRFSATVMLHDLSDNVTTYAFTPVMIRSPQEVWVRQLYQDLLQRPADDAGAAAWLGQLSQGVSRLQVVHEFEGSLEYRTKVVENLYTTLLGRPADPAGLAGYVQFLGQGGSAQQVEAAILSSAEYYQNRAGQNPVGFVSALYHDVLARPVDDIGAVRWSELLALGFGRDLVVSLVLSSAEAQRDQIEAVYQQFLGRPADATGMNGFASSLAQGASLGDVLAAIACSDEFLQRS